MRLNRPLASLTIFSSLALAGCEAHYYQEGPPQAVVVEPAAVVVQPVYVAPAPQVVTTFQADLNQYGQWVVVANYGQVWRPTQVQPTWRPYTVGHWVWTDYGWTWASEEPWGDATCHYGQWLADPQYGWVWVPGSTWAPAWVAWRSGGGYVGWAPLPPTVVVGVSIEIGERHTREIPAAQFCFVEERRVAEPRLHEHITSIQTNTTIITKTVNITNITTVNNTVINKSLTVEHVEKAAGHKIQRVTVKEASSEAEARQMRTRGEVAAYRPKPLVEAERTRVDDARRRAASAETDRARTAELKKQEAEKARTTEADRARAAELHRQETEKANAAAAKRAEADKAHAAELKRQEAEKARASEAERARAAELQRQEAEKANAAAAAKRAEADKARTAELKRQEADKAKTAEAERARQAELKRQEAEKIKAAEAERAKAAEAKRREEADRPKKDAPKPPPAGETKEQAAERAKREAAEKEAAEKAKKP